MKVYDSIFINPSQPMANKYGEDMKAETNHSQEFWL